MHKKKELIFSLAPHVASWIIQLIVLVFIFLRSHYTRNFSTRVIDISITFPDARKIMVARMNT